MTEIEFFELCQALSLDIQDLLQDLLSILPQKDHNYKGIELSPSLLPFAIAQMGGREFTVFVKPFLERLVQTFSETFPDELEEEHKNMRKAFAKDPDFKSMVVLTEPKKEFEDAWKPFRGRFPKLIKFLGGLGTVFPGTLLVEADFLVLKWTKDENSASLTDFSLEGILHAKQFCQLCKI